MIASSGARDPHGIKFSWQFCRIVCWRHRLVSNPYPTEIPDPILSCAFSTNMRRHASVSFIVLHDPPQDHPKSATVHLHHCTRVYMIPRITPRVLHLHYCTRVYMIPRITQECFTSITAQGCTWSPASHQERYTSIIAQGCTWSPGFPQECFTPITVQGFTSYNDGIRLTCTTI